jgi:putative heme-binding domain-containing protein
MPGKTQIRRSNQNTWDWPDGAVLVQTIFLSTSGKPGHKVETRILTKQSGVWAGYSYVWNDSQDDATLAPSGGAEVAISDTEVAEKTGLKTWKVPGRTDCMSCHSRAANFVLGLNELQSSCTVKSGGAELNQLELFEQWNLIGGEAAPPLSAGVNLRDPYHSAYGVDVRARSYLHVNCSSCHVFAGGGNSRMQLNIEKKLDEMQLIGAPAQHGTFGLSGGMLVSRGNPANSVLLQRLSRRGVGQMPPRGSQVVDAQAVKLFHDWISQLPSARPFVRDWATADVDLKRATVGRSHETGSRLFREIGCAQCHRFPGNKGGAGPDLTGIGTTRTSKELLESIIEPSKQITPGFGNTIVTTTDGKVFEGRIVNEEANRVLLQPLDVDASQIALSRNQIDSRSASKQSTMPTDLVDTLQESEILDLIAYLIANGEPNHSAYQK